MKRLLFIYMAFMNFIAAATISGHVVDAETGESIIGVNVFIESTQQGSATDLDGFFIIRNVASGPVSLKYSHIAYKTKIQVVNVNRKNIYLEGIEIVPQAIAAEAVEVIGNRSQIIEKDLDIASFEVDPVVLTEIPQMNKDVFKLVKFSPSVTVSDAFSPQYYVRGSDPGENMVQLDGMTIYNPQHFLGSNAIFNPYAIKNIEMLVGGFDAEYGGRNASILNISTREGHQSEVHGEFRPSISGISGAIEFPVKNAGTAMLSGRALTDIMTRVLMGSPNYMADFNGAFLTKIGNTQLRFSGFLARDFMDYSMDNLMLFFPDTLFSVFEVGFVAKTTNRAIGLKTNTVLRPNLLLETHVYHSGSTVDNRTYFAYDVEDTTEVMNYGMDFNTRIENSILDYTGKTNLTWFTFWNQTFKLGLELNHLTFTNEMGRKNSKSDPSKIQSDIHAFFIQDKIELGPLIFKAGLRHSRTRSGNTWQQEPRFSASMKIQGITIKAAYGHYYQYLTTLDSKNDEFIQFLEYYTSIDELKPINSIHHILGIEGKITPQLDYSLTGYYKLLNRLYRSSYSNNWLASEQGTVIESGKGKSYGVECLVRGEVGKWSGWVSYNWSRGFRIYPTVLNGKTVIFDGDQPHNLKTVLMYKLTEDITASSTFQFTSGYPRTWETGWALHYKYDPVMNNIGAVATTITPVKNNVRYPSRLNWEIGWKKQLRSGFGFYLAEYLGGIDAAFTMTIRNILFLHRNPMYYYYIPGFGNYALDMEFIPSVSAGYSIRF